MAVPSDRDLQHCKECGRLMEARQGRTTCRNCADFKAKQSPKREKLESIRKSDKSFGSPGFGWKEVYEAVQELPELTESSRCVRCRSRIRLKDAEFCLQCHIDLDRDFGDASEDLFGRMEDLGSHPKVGTGIISALNAKRDQTPTSRINPVGGRRIKY